MSTLKTVNVQHPSSASANVTLDSSGNTSVAGNLSFNSGYGSAAVAYGCRAWVNFNGTGTVAIRASGNVSSITDNGVGDYTVNFSTALSDANYAVAIGAQNFGTNTNTADNIFQGASPTTSAFRIQHVENGVVADTAVLNCAVFR